MSTGGAQDDFTRPLPARIPMFYILAVCSSGWKWVFAVKDWFSQFLMIINTPVQNNFMMIDCINFMPIFLIYPVFCLEQELVYWQLILKTASSSRGGIWDIWYIVSAQFLKNSWDFELSHPCLDAFVL